MLPNVFNWFLDQDNIGLHPQIMILHDSYEISSESHFFF